MKEQRLHQVSTEGTQIERFSNLMLSKGWNIASITYAQNGQYSFCYILFEREVGTMSAIEKLAKIAEIVKRDNGNHILHAVRLKLKDIIEIVEQ